LVGVPVFAGKRSAGSTRLVDILQAAEVAGRRGLAAVDPTWADEQQHASRRHHGAAPHCGSRSAGSQVKNCAVIGGLVGPRFSRIDAHHPPRWVLHTMDASILAEFPDDDHTDTRDSRRYILV
jgi:hypothetical protein